MNWDQIDSTGDILLISFSFCENSHDSMTSDLIGSALLGKEIILMHVYTIGYHNVHSANEMSHVKTFQTVI